MGGADVGELPLEVCVFEMRGLDMGGNKSRKKVANIPFSSGSRHSNVISKRYLSVNLAGLLATLTPRSVTTDILSLCFKIRQNS